MHILILILVFIFGFVCGGIFAYSSIQREADNGIITMAGDVFKVEKLNKEEL